MKKKASFIVTFLALLLTAEGIIALAVHLSRPAEIPVARGEATPDSLIDRLDAFMVENLERSGLAGALLAVAKNDRVLYTAGYGYASAGAPVTPATPMPIASLTKSFTAAAIMRLVEQDKLRLGDSVRDRLPELELTDPRGALITIEQLLNQSSGLANRALPPQPARPPVSLAERIEWLRGATLVSDPGTAFNYCNENYNVLARVIEHLAGMPYAAFLETELLRPLGMDATRAFLAAREPMPGVANGHILLYGALVPRRMPDEFIGGGGGIVSSANDLAQWLVLQGSDGKTSSGGTILSRESLEVMHTISAPGSNYGFGWRRDSVAGEPISVHHSGVMQTFTAHARLFPDTGYAYAFVLNTGHSFRAEAASFVAGLNAIMTDRTPTIGPPYILLGLPFALIADNVMAILTVLVVSLGFVASARARDWAKVRASDPAWRIVLHLTAFGGLVVAAALWPWIMSAVNRGQPVSFAVMFSVWPAFVILLAAAAAAGMLVVGLRVAWIASLRAAAGARSRGGDGPRVV